MSFPSGFDGVCKNRTSFEKCLYITLKFDDSRMEELKDFILKFGEEASERKANRFYQNPNSPRYNKSFRKAAENGEKYLFIASYNRDMMCMEYFESNISKANHSGKTDDFMKSWVSKFGVGRCKSILAQVINDSLYDGRYEKEVKEDVRKYRFGSKDKEYPLIRTNEHPGRIKHCLQGAYENGTGENQKKQTREIRS